MSLPNVSRCWAASRFPLSRVTTFRIGGPAELAAKPRSPADAADLVRWAKGEGLPIRCVGMGSNLLVDDAGVNDSSRVCVPASVSTFSVRSSCQVMWSRPGSRMTPPTPYARHDSPAASSRAGSQLSATLRPSAFRGTLATSPFGGVTIRQRQSSLTMDTQ